MHSLVTYLRCLPGHRDRIRKTGSDGDPGLSDLDEVVLSLDDGSKYPLTNLLLDCSVLLGNHVLLDNHGGY